MITSGLPNPLIFREELSCPGRPETCFDTSPGNWPARVCEVFVTGAVVNFSDLICDTLPVRVATRCVP